MRSSRSSRARSRWRRRATRSRRSGASWGRRRRSRRPQAPAVGRADQRRGTPRHRRRHQHRLGQDAVRERDGPPRHGFSHNLVEANGVRPRWTDDGATERALADAGTGHGRRGRLGRPPGRVIAKVAGASCRLGRSCLPLFFHADRLAPRNVTRTSNPGSAGCRLNRRPTWCAWLPGGPCATWR